MALFTPTIAGQKMSPIQALKAGAKYSPEGAVASGVYKTFKKAALGSAAIFGATMLYFMGLGAAALKGAIIGATIGGTAGGVAGAYIGANLGAAIGTFLIPIPGVGTVVGGAVGAVIGGTTGAFIGGTVGAIAGGLIALGIASGSATLVSMGVGSGVGGAVGGYVGFVAGSAISATIMTAAIGACIASAICAPLAPFLIAVSPAVVWAGGALGALVGATVGTIVGGAIGYAIGHYVVGTIGATATGAAAGAAIGFMVGGPAGAVIGAGVGYLATGGWVQVKDFFSGAAGASGAGAGAVGGFFAAAGSFLTGAASFFWNNVVVGGAKAAWGFVSGLAEKGIGALSSAAGGGASIAAPAVGGAVGTVVVGSTIVGIVTSTAFFNPEVDNVLARVGDTPYMTVSKIASPNRIRNDDLPKEITFFITIKAKYVRLNNIDIEDKLEVESNTGTFEVTTDIDGNSITEPCQGNQPPYLLPGAQWNCQFTIRATNDSSQTFADSLITNIITFVATPEGQEPIGTAGTALVIIGGPAASPPATVQQPEPNVPLTPGPGCPNGWPTAHGYITQGPLGSASHARLATLLGERAIDIGGNDRGTLTKATFSGVVTFAGTNGGYGKMVEIVGHCNGVGFSARWAHLQFISASITPNSQITAETTIGGIDNTGHSFGDHLHYSFFGLPMRYPFIPENIASPNCQDNTGDACGVFW